MGGALSFGFLGFSLEEALYRCYPWCVVWCCAVVGLLEWWGGVCRVCECEMVCCGVVQAGSKWLWCLWWSVGLESVHSWERCLPFLLSETVGEPFTTLSVTGRTKPSCPMEPKKGCTSGGSSVTSVPPLPATSWAPFFAWPVGGSFSPEPVPCS